MSLIPLGFWAASAGGAAGSFDLLETQVLASSAASVTFSGLDAYAADYKHLQIRVLVRGAGAFGSLRGQLTFNGSTSGYSSHELTGNGSSVGSGAYTSESFLRPGRLPGNTQTSGSFGAQVIDILDPFETKNTTIRTLGGSTAYNYIYLTSGLWNDTSALTSISYSLEAGEIITASRFSIYGIRG